MRQDTREWLPDTAFTEDSVKAALAGVTDAWARTWFSARTFAVSRIRTGRGKSLAPSDMQRLHGELAIADIPESGKRHLLEAVLDAPVPGQTLLESDRKILELFASRMIEDLIRRLDTAFGDSAGGDGARVSFALSFSGDEILSVSLPQHALVRAIKAGLGGARRARTGPRPRHKALGPTHVDVKGLLGHAQLAVDDLQGLAQGDVLILDRALHETVELRLTGSDRPVGRGRLGRKDGRVSIQF